MKCADPVLCYLDSKGKRKFRNFSFARKSIQGIPLDHIVFDCGKCLSCRKKRAYELAARCVLHSSLYKENCFLTLTYDEKKDGYHNRFEYADIQKFKKRLRSYCRRTLQKTIEVFNVHEYGKNGKKHWHLIVFNHDFSDKTLFTMRNSIPLYTSQQLSKLWPYGFNTCGDVSEASAMYTAQYMEKDFKNYNSHSAKKSHSKHSGLGRPYFEKHFKQILQLGFIPFSGLKLPVPRYFEKLARKHWAHFYDRTLFYPTLLRKSSIFREFSKSRPPNREIADLYTIYMANKKERILDLERQWNEVISQFLTSGNDPDFIKSNNNRLYDLRNKNLQENF